MSGADDSVTQWIGQLQAGDPDAAQNLWNRYFGRLVGFARRKLQQAPRGAADEEDVALSAFKSFWVGLRRGRFPRLRDRDGLWPLLVAITEHKAADHARQELRPKRGGGNVRDGSALAGVPDLRPTPVFADRVVEQCRNLLQQLPEDQLRTLAQLKLEGYTNEEIAARLGRSLPTIERKLRRIRRLWQNEVIS
jgi:DNA-directed RNA polymerase specialized sigma24 family protein